MQDSAGRLDAVVLLDAREEPSTVQVLEFVDCQAGIEKIWLLGRATLKREENRVLVRTCVLPAMELPQLEGRTAEYRLKQPTDAQIEQQLQALAQTRMETSEDDKPARAGDLVTIDFDAELEDGTRFSGSMGRDGRYHLAVGEELPEGVWQAVVGKKKQETDSNAECSCPIPTRINVRPERMRYTPAGCKKIVHQRMPELNDTFAQSFGQENMLALRAIIRDSFLEQEAGEARRIISHRMLHALSDETIVELPQLAVELEAEYQWRQLENRLEKSGISLESHLRRLHKTREKLDASIRAHAAEDMKLRAVFLAVARQEGLTVSDAETEAAARAATRGTCRSTDRSDAAAPTSVCGERNAIRHRTHGPETSEDVYNMNEYEEMKRG